METLDRYRAHQGQGGDRGTPRTKLKYNLTKLKYNLTKLKYNLTELKYNLTKLKYNQTKLKYKVPCVTTRCG